MFFLKNNVLFNRNNINIINKNIINKNIINIIIDRNNIIINRNNTIINCRVVLSSTTGL